MNFVAAPRAFSRLRERLEYGGGPGVVHGGLHRREDRGQVPGGHAFLRRVVGETQRAFVRFACLPLQRDLDAVDDPFRGGDHVLRLAQLPALDRLFRGREDLHGLIQVDVVRDEVRDLRADGLHPSMDRLRALLLRSDVLFLGLPLRVVRGPLEFLDLGDARLAVPRFRVRRLGVLEHPGRRVDRHAVRLRERDDAARFAEHLRGGAAQ